MQAIKITAITPKPGTPASDPVSAHLSIENFEWVNEQNQQTGRSSRALMFDWIVNKKGRAYIKKNDGKVVFIFGANAPTGQYIRSVEDGKWTDELLSLPQIAS